MSALILVPLLPLVAAVLVAVGDPRWLEQQVKRGAMACAAAFLGSVATLVLVTLHGPVSVRFYDPDAAGFALPLGFYIDRLSGVMMVLITLVGTIIYVYSTGYLAQDRQYRRYMTLIAVTLFILLCMVSSANLLMLFVCWQILSWLLFLLAHNHAHAATLAGACTTFSLLRVGDVAFLSGIVLAYSLYGTVEFEALFARAADSPGTVLGGLGLEMDGPTAVGLLLFIGCMTKSAQFPLHLWLPRSLYAPTPVHALLHAGIINAGGFLMTRLAPLYGLSPVALHVAFVIGMLTAMLGATMMLTQNDIKKTLGFSTIGQMGYMIMECGLGAFSLAVFHLIAHGIFKATVFLNCGAVIHHARQEPAAPPSHRQADEPELSTLTWSTGFVTTLLLPLVILLGTHGVLRIPLLESQGTVIFLFFIWVTSSQAILSLTRIRAVASWKVSLAMLATLIFVLFTYLFAAEALTHFLFPDPQVVAGYFQAAAIPGVLFDAMVVGMTLLTMLGWGYLYARAHGRTIHIPERVHQLIAASYILFMNRLYLDAILARASRLMAQAAARVDRIATEWHL